MRQTQDYVPYASPLSCSSFPRPHICPSSVIHLPLRCRSLSYQTVEGDGDLLASKRPPLACVRGPYILQDVFPCNNVLFAELPGEGHLQVHRDAVLG